MSYWNVIIEQDGEASIKSNVKASSVVRVLDVLRELFPAVDWEKVSLIMVSQAKP